MAHNPLFQTQTQYMTIYETLIEIQPRARWLLFGSLAVAAAWAIREGYDLPAVYEQWLIPGLTMAAGLVLTPAWLYWIVALALTTWRHYREIVYSDPLWSATERIMDQYNRLANATLNMTAEQAAAMAALPRPPEVELYPGDTGVYLVLSADDRIPMSSVREWAEAWQADLERGRPANMMPSLRQWRAVSMYQDVLKLHRAMVRVGMATETPNRGYFVAAGYTPAELMAWARVGREDIDND
jgi:hypothetical protein